MPDVYDRSILAAIVVMQLLCSAIVIIVSSLLLIVLFVIRAYCDETDEARITSFSLKCLPSFRCSDWKFRHKTRRYPSNGRVKRMVGWLYITTLQFQGAIRLRNGVDIS